MSTSSAEIDPRREEVGCRDCGRPVEVTVLYRKSGEDWIRGATPPVMCDGCTAADRAVQDSFGAGDARPVDEADWLRAHGVNTRKHGHATLENFDGTHAPRATAEAQAFVQATVAAGRHDRVGGLYLVGSETGTGKSHLAVAIMRAVHEARPDLHVVFEPADRLVTRVQDSYGSGTTDTLIEERARADLYVLDDLGREKGTADALRVLCTILDEREGAPTVITSNCLPRELGARHDDEAMWARVASRLGDAVYRYVAIKGPDRRFQAVS